MQNQKAVVRFYFDNNDFKTFLILPRTTVSDLVTQVQKKMENTKKYYLYYTVDGKESYLKSSDAPWAVWEKYGEKAQFLFKLHPPPDQQSSSTPNVRSPSISSSTPNTNNQAQRISTPPAQKPAPSRASTTSTSASDGFDDFDNLLSQLTELDVNANQKTNNNTIANIGGGDVGFIPSANMPVCSACGEAITQNLLVAFGMNWHKEHLACAICRRTFLDNDVPVVEGIDGNAYCQTDFNEKFAPKCARCQQTITGQVTNALGKQWHPNCFTCWTCSQPFQGTYFESNGRALCEKHYYDEMGLICPDCEKPIIGKCVLAKGQRYHPAHFRCAHCKTKLAGNEYFLHNSRLYCKKCSIIFYG